MSSASSSSFKITQALISVSNKNNLASLALSLKNNNISILSSGGTNTHLNQHNITTTEVSKYCNHPEILSGRVKTLQPKIFGGILARDDNQQDMRDLAQNDINNINLVIVNLYPFQEQLEKLTQKDPNQNIDINNLIEYIDIGGPSLIRAAAKNYKCNLILVDPNDYNWLTEKLNSAKNDNIDITLSDRQKLAAKAFAYTSQYEQVIDKVFRSVIPNESLDITEDKEHTELKNKLPTTWQPNFKQQQILRYGENPEQFAAVYVDQNNNTVNNNSLAQPHLLQGKALSYNNLLDSNTAINIINTLNKSSVLNNYANCAIIKHATPCGVASCDNINDAYQAAFKADPKSAFGGIIALNKPITAELADTIISNQFLEVLIAPDILPEALDIIKTKPNIRLIKYNFKNHSLNNMLLKTIDGGLLVQTNMSQEDLSLDDNFTIVTNNNNLTEQSKLDLMFSWHIVQHVKSNAIVLSNNLQTIGIGGGQTSRVGSLELAITLAKNNDHSVNNTVMASDAFFPFADSIELASTYGIKAIIQPGGSKQDSNVIAKANELGITMVFTHKRKFCH